MAILMDGKHVAEIIRKAVKETVAQCNGRPRLAIISNSSDAASAVYVKNKAKDCSEVGISCDIFSQDSNTKRWIDILNDDDSTHGIICQLPVINELNEKEIINSIDPSKDVDGFTSGGFDPCTPAGIMELLKYYKIEISGKHCVVVGRSNIVGRPMAKMLLDADATVTICHSRTFNLKSITRQADILIVAAGKRNLITADMVKPGVVVVDVGMNKDENGRLCGDVDFDGVYEKASYITPVPGGVGPMTRAMLLVNTVKAFKNLQKNS